MRKKIIAANWKMNKSFTEVQEFVKQLPIDEVTRYDHTQVILCVPFIYLQWCIEYFKHTQIAIGAQNVHDSEKGAFTGEISAIMLKSIGTTYCIVGHSERRQYFNETDSQIAQKIELLHKYSIIPIFCCGETLEQRNNDIHFNIVEKQLNSVIKNLSYDQMLKTIIAYEPVWAIGTGINATAYQAQEMHTYIRKIIQNNFNDKIAQNVIILYGGSCNSSNAHELFSCADVDGGLIGSASLNVYEFTKIVKIAQDIQKNLSIND